MKLLLRSSIRPSLFPHRVHAFSLIELVCVMAIVTLLATLSYPSIERARLQAEQVTCASNLRQVGLNVLQIAQDNNNVFPKIENDPGNPVYSPEDGAQTLPVLFKSYGISDRVLRCSADVRSGNFFVQKGTSYQWFPLVDGEMAISPKLYLPAGILNLPLSHIPVAADFSNVHSGDENVLFADGHVKAL